MKRRSILEIDLSKLESNYRRIASAVAPCKVISVLKADAYGLGVKAYAKALYRLGCRDFAVADPVEAQEMAGVFGYSKDVCIQILSSVLPEEIAEMVSLDVVLPVVDFESAAMISSEAVSAGKNARVQFKLDAGMGRLGVRTEDAIAVLKKVSRLPNIDIEGAFSHFPNATKSECGRTEEQIAKFKKFLSQSGEEGLTFRKIHIAASDAINNFPETATSPFNFVRAGLDLHGGFCEEASRRLGLQSVIQFKSKIAQVRMLRKGTPIGYNSTFTLDKDARIAVVAAGYADGVPLQLSNKGSVLVKGVPCPIIGRVSMDYTTIDVSGVECVKPGDEAVLIGESMGNEMSLNEWSDIKGTHPYDILTSFGNRVERVLFRGR